MCYPVLSCHLIGVNGLCYCCYSRHVHWAQVFRLVEVFVEGVRRVDWLVRLRGVFALLELIPPFACFEGQ